MSRYGRLAVPLDQGINRAYSSVSLSVQRVFRA